MSKVKKPIKITLSYSQEFVPDKGELLGIYLDTQVSLMKHLIQLPEDGKLTLEVGCQKCGYMTPVNPNQNSKSTWLCRNCGGMIVYDILG